MRNSIIIVFLILVNSIGAAQEYKGKKMSVDELREDFEIFKNTLRSVHPNLYLYTSESTLDSMMRSVENKLTDNATAIEFFRLLTPLIHAVRNSHTTIRPPEPYLTYIKTDSKRLPMHFLLRNDSLIVVENYSPNKKIKSGDLILKINRMSPTKLMDSLEPYTFVDGYNKHYSDYISSKYLSRRYAYFLDEPLDFLIEFKDSIGNIKVEHLAAIAAKEFHTIKNTQPDKKKYDFRIENNTAFLRVSDFRLEDVKKFKKDLKGYFKQIKKQNISCLILDLRNNKGGFPENTDNILSYLIKEEVHPIKEKFTLVNELNEYEYILKDKAYEYFQNSKKGRKSNGIYILDDEAKIIVEPNKNHFKGKLVVLINENCASATTSLLGQIKTQVPDVIFIGNTTLGNPFIVSASYMVSLRLPHSKIIVKIPLVSSKKNVDFKNPNGGVVPDIMVPITLEDVLGKTDNVLRKANETVLELKKAGHNKTYKH